MADNLGIMLTELPEATNIGDDDLMYIVQDNDSEKVKVGSLKNSILGGFYGEASGNPASFVDGSASNLVECETEIVPVQDLHGYSKPWIGGAGKNKIDYSLAVYSLSDQGMTYNINNGRVEFSGTPTLNVYIVTKTFSNLPDGNYKIIINTDANFNFQLYETGGLQNLVKNGETSFTMDSTKTGYMIAIRPTVNTPTSGYFEIMIINASETYTSFEPYANICPISGHSSVTINVSPSNDSSQGVDTTIQLGDTYYGGTLNAVTGELTVDRAIVTIDGNETGVTWTDIGNNMRSSILNLVVLHNVPPSTGANADAISNYLEKVPRNYSTDVSGFYWYDENQVYIKLPKSILASADTTGCNQYLQAHNLDICYELATPITVQIPPTTINTLLGQNYISSEDTENIDVVYTKSTSPIKPNPSGEVDGYLSSIELSGEKFEIIKELPTFPTSDGDYKLKLSVSSGVPTLSWVSDT